jgi:transcriptional regulator with XRE-family HTH domain
MRDLLLTQLGRRIKTHRMTRGWTQVEFAERIGMDRSFLADVERGKRNISVLNLNLIAQGLGVSLSRLFARMQ